ncbi:MAG TPA: LuxR C-terminal-related transcriptional regulator [Actinomycetes bacterium]|nr:LuxR C-terminal-related transcriptional regulator [Actinomycetes bacterium]
MLLVEDVHWADDATLDVLRYLAWRIPELPCVLVLTYREDELRGQHPLRRVLAALPHQEVRRLVLRPLSAGAVQELAGASGADAAAVLAATAGNPFFVTEVLANPGVEVPATVRDAVLARLAGLTEPTRRALELLATVPGQVERWLGAVAAGTLVRRDLRRMGASHLPRRPRPRTRANPAGLTDRQLEVLALLAEGLTNAEIADRLVVSVRTVDHHVAAILAKLGVGSRREAARAAATLGA